jgi:predicted MFS family arabinose efflux permease
MTNILNYLGRLYGFNRNAKLFLASTLLNGLGISLLVLLYNLYILSLGFRQDMIGLVTLTACLAAVIASLPMAWVANRIGYKAAQVIGIAGSALSLAVPLVWPTAEALIVTELIWGVAFTLVTIVGAPFMSENSSEEDRPYLFSIQFVLLTLTAFIGSLLGGELPRLFGMWWQLAPESPGAYQGALGVGIALMLASAAPLFFLEAPTRRHAHAARPRLTVRDRMKVMRLLLPLLLGAAGGGMFVPFVNVFWKVSHNLDDATIGQIFALSALLMTAMGLVAPILSRRWGMVRVMVVTQFMSVVSLLMFGFSRWFIFAVVGFLGRDVLMNLSRPLFGQFQMEETEVEERAAVSSLSTMAFNLAWGVGSWISGLWQTEGQFALVFVVSAAFYLASVGSLQGLFGYDRRREPTLESALASRPIALGPAAE